MASVIATRQLAGMSAVVGLWIGQVASLAGSAMTRFALGLWAWEQTGQATVFALVSICTYGASAVAGPIAGVLVDRWPRKTVLLASDAAAAATTLALLLLLANDALAIWHLYAAGIVAGAAGAVQFPAYSAAVTTLVPKARYGRANGLFQTAEWAADIGAPLLAGALLAPVGIVGIMAFDLATFLVAALALLLARIPSPTATTAGLAGRGSFWHQVTYGLRYLWERPALFRLQSVYLGINCLTPLYYVLLSPLILARTGDDAAILGAVLSVGGIGGVAGGFLMSAWGGPRRRIAGMLGGNAAWAACGLLLLGLGRGLPLWAVASFGAGLSAGVLMGSGQAFWQTKVAPDIQGRVFAARRIFAQIGWVGSLVFAGPLADRLFEPAMRAGGALAPLFGPLVGVGRGAGLALMATLAGVLMLLLCLGAWLTPAIREVETRVPDHDGVPG